MRRIGSGRKCEQATERLGAMRRPALRGCAFSSEMCRLAPFGHGKSGASVKSSITRSRKHKFLAAASGQRMGPVAWLSRAQIARPENISAHEEKAGRPVGGQRHENKPKSDDLDMRR